MTLTPACRKLAQKHLAARHGQMASANPRTIAYVKPCLWAACFCAIMPQLVADCVFGSTDGNTYYQTSASCGLFPPCGENTVPYYDLTDPNDDGCCYQITEDYDEYQNLCSSYSPDTCNYEGCDNECYALFNPVVCAASPPPPSISPPPPPSEASLLPPSPPPPAGNTNGSPTPPPPAPKPNGSPTASPSGHGGLTTSATVGIAVGVTLAVILVIVCIVFRNKWKRARATEHANEPPPPPPWDWVPPPEKPGTYN